MHEVVTLGEPMALISPDEALTLDQATTLTLGIAGAESNVAILLRRFGHSIRFISRVGNDPFGQRIRATLAQEGIDTTGIRIDDTAPTGVFFREWLPDGQRRVFYYRTGSAASRLTPDDLHPDVFSGTRLLHITGITPALSSTCAATVERAIDLAHAAGAFVSFDPNYRPTLWTPAKARNALLPLIQKADILLMGHEDSQAIFGVDHEERVILTYINRGCKIVVLKQAERGACAWDGKIRVSVPAEHIEAPIDPVGAGDAFDAGFLASWLRGGTLEEALFQGNRVGAATVMTVGDYISQERFTQLFNSGKLQDTNTLQVDT